MLYWFLLYNNMTQLQVYTYPLPLEPPSNPYHLTHKIITGHWANCAVLQSCFMLAFCFTHDSVCMSVILLIRLTLSILHKSFHCPPVHFYISVSLPPLQVCSSVPFFWIPYICINIWYLFDSFWLHFVWQAQGSSTWQLTQFHSFL